MNEDDVKRLALHGLFEGKPVRGTIEETHISWVVLSGDKALKIKKPVKLPFLDFSTKRLRKKFCERELELNRRFSHIYLSVLPITRSGSQFQVGGEGRHVDYAVVMKRLDQAKKMDCVLRSSGIDRDEITRLANTIARFHLSSERIFTSFDLTAARNTFNDIDMIRNVVENNLGQGYTDRISLSKDWSDAFLRRHQERFQQRIVRGFKRDVHGDLHSGNVFLYHRPVLFDCIEFNDQYRQIDVLYEIAFLCMELEFYGRRALGDHLLVEYLKRFRCLESPEDKDIFTYFKCLRANVRAKVHALQLRQVRSPVKRKRRIADLRKYLDLMNRYTGKQ